MFSLKCLIISYVVLITYHAVYAQPNVKFFRKDYTYLEEMDSFYKIHALQKTWQGAKEQCASEGAMLFFPEDVDEAKAVIKFWLSFQKYHIVYIGLSSPNARQVFETVDGRPISDVYQNFSPSEPNDAGDGEGCIIMYEDSLMNDDNCEKKYPFICKKPLNSIQLNTHCDIPGQGYQYVQSFRRCYKFYETPMNWTDAYTVCNKQQSHLAVINSNEEANYLLYLTENSIRKYNGGDYLSGAVHLGFGLTDNGWQTVRNMPLSETGYTNWGFQQPDGNGDEKCGSMFYNGRLNDIGCDQRSFFICEYEVPLLFNSYSIIFGKDNDVETKI